MLFQRRSLKFSAKVFERCELARELVNKQGFARATVGNWVCLANVGLIKIWICETKKIIFFKYESSYNTAATNDNTNGSRDYGIFEVIDVKPITVTVL